jgi:hypothetical protein
LDEATNQALQMLGMEMPTPAYLAGVLLFSVIGMVAFWRGRRSQQPSVKWLGLALMLYPYVIWGTLWLYLVGGALCAALWFYRRR